MNKSISLLIIVLLLLFSACASTTPKIAATVTTFHSLPEQITGSKYAFLPLKNQEDDLAYATYQNLFREKLKGYSFEEVPMKEAKYIIVFRYAVGEGSTQTASVPIVGQTGVSSSSSTGSLSSLGNQSTYKGNTTYMPTFGVVGSRSVTYQVYPRILMMFMSENNLGSKNKKTKIVYEGKVTSEGSSSEMAYVMPALVESLFDRFPGKSGNTLDYLVTMPSNKTKRGKK